MTSDQPTQNEQRSGYWTIFAAVAFVMIFFAATFAMQRLSGGATLVIEADKVSAAVISSGKVTIRHTESGLRYTLRAGRQSVKAGRYEIDVNSDLAELEFSTGPQFVVEAGQRVTITATGQPIEP